MAHDVQLRSDPAIMPLKSAVLLLIHKKRRQMFISYTSNARGRTAVLANAIRHRDTLKRNHLRNLPEGGVADFVVLAVKVGLEPREGDAMVEKLQRRYVREGYKMFGGNRSAMPKVVFEGKRMTLVEAMEKSGTTSGYQAVYRRVQRGWSIKEALDLADRAA